MIKSESIKELATALASFQKEIGNVAKDATNPFFKSKYASLENVISTVKPVLAKHGLSFSQFPDEDGLTTTLMHSSGEYLQASAKLLLKDQTPQGHGSAITYLRRYALSAILGIATEDDDDGNAAAPPRPATKPVARTTVPISKPAAVRSIEQQRLAAKKKIADLCDLKALNPLGSPEEYAIYVQENTGLTLEPQNYVEIISRLEALQ